MKNIAIFASGNGTNAQAIIEHFKGSTQVNVVLVVSNNPSAGVIKIAHQHKIISAVVSKNFFGNEQSMEKLLGTFQLDLIVLAGFLQLIPPFLLSKFPNRIINIHPALLPKYGGKGMYGKHVHEKVLANNDTETGITIHYVNENYDEGKVISQQKISLAPSDTIESISAKVQQLEHQWYPKIIEQVLS